MANSQTAFLRRSQVPDRQALQAAIKALKFKLTIDESYIPFACAGYIACTLDGEDAGFEIKFGESAAHMADAAHLQAQIADRDSAIHFRWSGDQRERASALMVCAVLAHNFDALILRPGADAFCAPDPLLDEARALFAQLQ
jgi:hypothetical protein